MNQTNLAEVELEAPLSTADGFDAQTYSQLIDNLPANVKTAMRMQGRDGGLPRAPMHVSTHEQDGAIREARVGAGLVA